MKKFIAIPLLVLYLVAVSGTMVQLHFCGSKLSSWKVNEQKASCCCGTAAAPLTAKGKTSLCEDNCCSDKVITLKIDQDQNTAHGIWLQFASLHVAALPTYTMLTSVAIPATAKEPAYRANAPPGLWQGIPLYKLHSRFTYYG